MKEKIKAKYEAFKKWAEEHAELIGCVGACVFGAAIGGCLVSAKGYTKGYLDGSKDTSSPSYGLGYDIGYLDGMDKTFDSLYLDAAKNDGVFYDIYTSRKTGARMGVDVKILPPKER